MPWFVFGVSNTAVLYKDFSCTAIGFALAFIGAALEGATSIAVPTLLSSPSYTSIVPYKDKQVRALSGLYARSPIGDRLFLVNSGKQEIVLQIPFKTCYMI